jgi:hypothetical protein
MVVIDAETGEYAVDQSGIHSAIALKAKNPNARLFTIRIGYDVSCWAFRLHKEDTGSIPDVTHPCLPKFF